MTRQRSTWSEPTETSRQAATSRRADIYTMNQEHPQPSPVDYESGDPDAWAETPTTNKNVEQEYEGDAVKRNEVGFGEFRDDTWKHKDADKWNAGGKYDNKTAAERKARSAERLARALLRTDNQQLIEDQAVALMGMPQKHLSATLRRLNQVSPDALPQEAKYKRALACCKLAARVLPENTTEQFIEKLATTFMTIDDPTLREMLRITAAADSESDSDETTAAAPPPFEKKEEKEEDEGKAAAEKKDEDEDGPKETEAGRKMRTPEGPPTGMGEPKEEDEGKEGCEACLQPADAQMLDTMVQQEAGPAPELTQLFEQPPAPAPAGPVPAMPIASGIPEISFNDEEDESRTASDTSELDSLFADHPEVQAQREMVAAEQEQQARESAYGSEIRTASTGAKKLGRVQANKNPDTELENLWERPA